MGAVALTLIILAVTLPVSLLVNHVVPQPYMDEIFHVPQGQKYCEGKFTSWDPMITTPPGLYLMSLPYVCTLFPVTHLMGLATTFQKACSTEILRSVNIVFAVICSIIFYHIIRTLRPDTTDKSAMLYAFVLSLYPLHWFFTFLFYTDVGSTTAVMAMYLACLKQSYWLSGLLGCLAVTFRQTNIIWVAFVAAVGIIDYVNRCNDKSNRNSDVYEEVKENSSNVNNLDKLSLRRRKKLHSRKKDNHAASEGSLEHLEQSMFVEFQRLTYKVWHNKWSTLANFFPFLLVALAFTTFVLYNGSVVLGAKDAHAVSPHFAQVLYFGLAAAAGMAPLHFNYVQLLVFFQSFKEGRLSFIFKGLFVSCIAVLAVHYFSLAHPYLLADNRHYTFYIWRKVLQRHWSVKYLLIPLYLYSWRSMVMLLDRMCGKIWTLVFCLATSAVVAPAPLIEFRYYTVPFYFIVLHAQATKFQWAIIGLIYSVINSLSIYLFLFKPFHWAHESGIQRFMW